ncbi:MAG: homocysteine S-methyltransferase family protein [Lachnospiraceae bacterium]|nr:homocysteine S-methyltransferase family protein [Lachnospiraceae bacterium]
MLQLLGKKTLFFDGGMGTQLQAAGLPVGAIPEELNIDDPKLIESVHARYLNAGADFITTNTFGANAHKMARAKYSNTDMIKAAVKIADTARKNAGREKDSYIALDIGPIGELLAPIGTLSFDDAYELFREQIVCVKDDIDVVIFETFGDLYELKAGVLAAKENCDKPVFVSMSFDKSGRTLTGSNPITYINVMEGLKVNAIGVNCSLGPKELEPVIMTLLENSHVPVLIQPNAGLPTLKDGKTVFELTPEAFVDALSNVRDKGIAMIGGCCGTTPDFIRAVKDSFPSDVKERNVPYRTAVSSSTMTVYLDESVRVCGERLNPTGKKKLQAALREEKYDMLISEAIAQEDAGAKVLDVNVGLPGIDEAAVMKKIIPMLQEVVSIPLQIDSSSPAAIEAACRVYNGKPLINSVNGKDAVMDAVFPVAVKYGGVVIGLTLSEEVPKLCEERVAIAKKIINKAESYGLSKKDLVIDCLTLTVSAQQAEASQTLEALREVTSMGLSSTLGVSNISFGLPNRPLINRTFLTLAMQSGLKMPIINPLDRSLMDCIDAFNVIYNIDEGCIEYIKNQENAPVQTTVVVPSTASTPSAAGSAQTSGASTKKDVGFCIAKGLKDEVSDITNKELESTDPMVLINETIIPALNKVGRDYDSGKIFLPQLIQAAETAKVAFAEVQKHFTVSGEKKGPVLICTVEGDIHDIGKNIVKVVCDSYGYEIIDLGKDVAVDSVVDAYKQYAPKVIGLSALMTTTVENMKRTIAALRANDCKVPITVGGAVLTEEIAKEIDADYYTEDAMSMVNLLKELNV